MDRDVHVVSAGLTGSSTAWQLAARGLSVTRVEPTPRDGRQSRGADLPQGGRTQPRFAFRSVQQAQVQVQACGVCHTDLHYREGGINDAFPFLLGHEAAGIVEAVGDDVTGVAPGDFVILNWRAVYGDCRACHRGKPQYCFATKNATQKMTLRDSTELSPALGIGAFAEKPLVAAGQCTKADPSSRSTSIRRSWRPRRDGRDPHRRLLRHGPAPRRSSSSPAASGPMS